MDTDKRMDIPKLIDHTMLRPEATKADIKRLCEEAAEHGFFAVCVHPVFIGTAKDILFSTHVKVSSVIGFPLGVSLSEVKIYEAMKSAGIGADELDIVMNLGLLKAGNTDAVERELSDIITATPGVVHKVIIEACYLTDDEKKTACRAVMNSGAEFIKTSTGFGPSGATVNDVRLIRSVTGGKIGIKAAGGVRTLGDVRDFIAAGATRIGTSSGVAIINELQGA